MYSKLSVRYYDAINAARGKNYAREAERLHALIQRYKRCPGNALLDVACGTGGHLAFLRRHYNVEGLDLNMDMLEIARRKCPGVAFHNADMSDFRLNRKFAVVVCLFSSVAYVQNVQMLPLALRNMTQHVEPGGLVIIEPWLSREKFQVGSVHAVYVDEPDLKVARFNVSTIEERLSVINFHYLVGTPDGISCFTERHQLGLFSHDDYMSAFRNGGMEVIYDSEGLIGRGLYIGLCALT